MSILLLLRAGGGGVGQVQQFGDGPELRQFFDDDGCESGALPSGFQQVDLQPQIEDAWDWSETDAEAAADTDAWIGIEDQSASVGSNVVPAAVPDDGWDWSQDDPETSSAPSGFQQLDLQPQIEDAWDHWVTDDDDYVVIDDYAIIDVLASSQYYGEDAELLDQDDDVPIVDDALSLPGDAPIEDGWDWSAQDDDEQPALPEEALAPSLATYYGEDAELLDQDDDDQVLLYNDPTDGVAAYYGEDAELTEQDDDPSLVSDDYPGTQDGPSSVFGDEAWDWFVTDDDDYLVIDDFQNVPLTVQPLQYFGEDAEAADLDADDDEWTTRDEANVQIPSLAQSFDDPWDWSVIDEDDWALPDDYALVDNSSPVEDPWDWSQDDDEQAPLDDFQQALVIAPPQYFGEDAELLDQDDDEQAPLDALLTAESPLAPDDPWDHFVTDEDDYAVSEDWQPAFVSLLLNIEDAWDHWPTDDADDYFVVDDCLFPAVFFLPMQGIGVSICVAWGVANVNTPRTTTTTQYPYGYDNSNAWLWYRSADGGGVFG